MSAQVRSAKHGLPPGTLLHVGEPGAGPARITLLDYDAGRFAERVLASPEEIVGYLTSETVSWIDVCGVHDVDTVGRIGSLLGIHPLVLEDVVTTRQRPKAEAYEGHLFVVLQMLTYDPEAGRVGVEQLSLVLGPRYVVSFRERPGDPFGPVRERIRAGKGRIRSQGPDYLAYGLLDLVVDHYFLTLEALQDRLEDLEERLLAESRPELLHGIHRIQRALVTVRRAVWPLRELVGALEREGSAFIAPATLPYLRDVYDHAVQVIDTVEMFRDVVAGYLDVYLTSVSNRMNEVMRVLTVIATVFIPLTFLVGVYGMNFEHMPELRWRWAYPALWAVMGAVAAGMLLLFRRRRWF